MEKKTNSFEKIHINLSKIKNKYNLPLKFRKSNNIFLSLPKLNTNNKNKNYEKKVKTIIIDKKLSKSIINTISNKKLTRTNSLTKTNFTGFFVIPKTSKTVQIKKVNIPITFTQPPHFKKNINFFNRNKKNNYSLYIKKPKSDRIYNNLFFDSRRKYPVGKIISAKGENNTSLNTQIYSFTIGSKFFSNIGNRKPVKKISFKEKVKEMKEEEKIKKIIKIKKPMNCREVLEVIKNERFSKTRRLIKEAIDERHRTKNDMAIFFDDFKKCKEFNDWDQN